MEAFWLMRSDPRVMEFIPLELATDREAIYQEFKKALAAGERFKFFNAVEWKNAPKDKEGYMIGWVLFRPTEDGRHVEIGYWFLPEAWGQGLATEAAKAMITGHSDTLGVATEDIYAEAFIGNDASRNVLEKVGLEVRGQGVLNGKPAWLMYWKQSVS